MKTVQEMFPCALTALWFEMELILNLYMEDFQLAFGGPGPFDQWNDTITLRLVGMWITANPRECLMLKYLTCFFVYNTQFEE